MAQEPVKKDPVVPNETAAAIQQLAEAMLAQAPKTPLEMSGLSKEAQHTLTTPGVPKRFRIIPGKSDETGATFDMLVVESGKAMPNGRVTQLFNYKHPDGMFAPQSQGGRMPDGFPFLKDNTQGVPEGTEFPRHMLSIKYLHWRWMNFWKVDLTRMVGKELKSHFCASDDGLKTPWQAGKAALVATVQE